MVITVKPGTNKLRRHSSESSATVPDVPSYKKLLEKAKMALENESELDLSKYQRSCGIPNRLLLPKGKPEGMNFWLSVFISDGKEDTGMDHPEDSKFGGTHSQCGIHGEEYPDKKPLLYPFDRRIPDDNLFMELDAFSGKLVKVYHIER